MNSRCWETKSPEYFVAHRISGGEVLRHATVVGGCGGVIRVCLGGGWVLNGGKTL